MVSSDILLIAIGIFLGMLIFVEIGRWIGQRRIEKRGDESGASYLALEGSVFGLMGLLIAFTFSAAASRFEMRRQLVVEEANDIGTAWKRLDLLPTARQGSLRKDFWRYVDNRLAVDGQLEELETAKAAMSRTKALQDAIWAESVHGCAEVASAATTNLVLTSVNAMIDIAATRAAAARTHLPWVIRTLLMVLPLICALLAGLDAAPSPHRSWVRMLAFAVMMSIAIFVILDLDYPRAGLIRIDRFDQSLTEIQNRIHGGL